MNIFTIVRPIKSISYLNLDLGTLNYLRLNKHLSHIVIKVPKYIHKTSIRLLEYYESDSEIGTDSSPEYIKLLESNMISKDIKLTEELRYSFEYIRDNELSNVESIDHLMTTLGIEVNCITDYRKALKSNINLDEWHLYPTRTSIKYNLDDYVICDRVEFYRLKSLGLSIEYKGNRYRHKDLYKFNKIQ